MASSRNWWRAASDRRSGCAEWRSGAADGRLAPRGSIGSWDDLADFSDALFRFFFVLQLVIVDQPRSCRARN